MKRPQQPSGSSKLLSLKRVRLWAKSKHELGKTIVATNGCFDLLHPGHVSYLQRARQLGDCLVIGLNSDASVRQLKGPSRPLVEEKHRAAVLSALECVDAVVIFRTARATGFLRAVQPDIYVKGGDYRPETLHPAERAVLDSANTRIEILPFLAGFSTTQLIAKIRQGASL